MLPALRICGLGPPSVNGTVPSQEILGQRYLWWPLLRFLLNIQSVGSDAGISSQHHQILASQVECFGSVQQPRSQGQGLGGSQGGAALIQGASGKLQEEGALRQRAASAEYFQKVRPTKTG